LIDGDAVIAHQTTTTPDTRRLLDLWAISDDSFGILVSSLNLPAPSSAADDESMLGDRIIPEADFTATFEAETTAPPAVVWSWVAQAMRGAGMYGWRRLDGARSRSARHLVDGIPPPRVGDRLGGLFEICRLDRHNAIVWKNLGPMAFLESSILEATLEHQIEPTRPEGTRLTARLRCVINGSSRPIGTHAASVLAYILPRCQVSTLTQHAETSRRGPRQPLAAGQVGTGFQHTPLTPAAARRGEER
jgi:hypothetical protein